MVPLLQATWSHSAAGLDQLTDTVLDKTVEFCTVSKLTSSHPKHSTTPPALLNGIWGWSSHWLILAFLVIILVWGWFIFWTYGIKEKDYTVSSTSDSNGKYAKRANRAVICILQSKTMKKKAKIFTIFVEVWHWALLGENFSTPTDPASYAILIGQLSHNVIGRLSVISHDVIGYEDSS